MIARDGNVMEEVHLLRCRIRNRVGKGLILFTVSIYF